MFTRIPLKSGYEFDALTAWRKIIKGMSKPGRAKYAKRKYNRRFRRESKMKLKGIFDD